MGAERANGAIRTPDHPVTSTLFEGGHLKCGCDVAATVVVPVYNGLPLVLDQLAALARQQFDLCWEVVLADNGSTDELLRRPLHWRTNFHRLRIVDASSVRGPAHARNSGASVARGDLLLFCDADDVADPGLGWGDVPGLGLRQDSRRSNGLLLAQ